MIISDFIELLQNALLEINDLVQKQQAKIERLESENLILSQKRANIFEISDAFERGKAEGIKASGTQLPCTIGDTVYQIYGGMAYEAKIKGVIFITNYAGFDKDEIGRNVFLTREEAEQVLKERS